MSSQIDSLIAREYAAGFVTDIEQDTLPPGLDEDVIREISKRKNEPKFMLDWRLKAYRRWLTMAEPHWPNVKYPAIDYQSIRYFSAPKKKTPLGSLSEVDPEILKTYEKLGIPLNEQKMLAGVAVDAIFDSVSVGTTFREELMKHGVIFCSFGEAVQERQFLRRAEFRRLLGRIVLLRAEGRALPDGAVDVFPHQRG
jgi:Fe-S cluster assembly protein SufB